MEYVNLVDYLIGGNNGKLKNNHNEFLSSKCSDYHYIPHFLQPTSKTIAIGDIHGDLELAINTLILAECIKEVDDKNENTVCVMLNDEKKYYEWIGGDTQVVQVGDQIDRCRPIGDQLCTDPKTTDPDEASDVVILKLYTKLDKIARNHGGKVISLLGNHELMNVMGNMKYVSYKNIIEFADKNNKDIKKALHNRIKAFTNKNNNGLNKFLACTRVSAIIIGNILFIHAGIISAISDKYGIDDINKIVRNWLLGKVEDEYIGNLIHNKKKDDINIKRDISYLIESQNSIFWNRFLGNLIQDIDGEHANTDIKNQCDDYLNNVFDTYKIGNIIIGHTPQKQHDTLKHKINSTCGQRVWRVDIGASKAFNKFRKDDIIPEILKITYKGDDYKEKFEIIRKSD